MLRTVLVVSLVVAAVTRAAAEGVDRPWIAATYFYWYTWDYQQEYGGWVGGVYNTPLDGYYHSPSYRDNLRSLRTACEWGLTDFFMDYWGPGWKGDEGEPREATVMRAAEEVQRRGYDMHMSFYQDGEKFNMADFERNLDPGQDFRFYVENWGASPVLPRIDLQPVYVIYSRNGAPKPTQDNEGFREWLQPQYDLVALNRAWDTGFTAWDQVTLDFASGRRRADSIRYATHIWKTQWQRTQQRATEELRASGPRVSFDVAYQPFLGWGYSALAKSLGGPHSYAGIFGRPHDEDTERFIQAQVAKAYGTVFFDHFKNFYHDVEIRTPGTIYPADFCAFDRFWAGALVRRSEALLHLSWNEWWEGSNLEPCWEYGKTYCEKNLLWSTVMKQCFDSLHNWNRGAKVGVLLNDWLWMVNGRHTEDVYGCLQALRRSNVTFDLLPDDFVTRDRLANMDLVIAPTGAAGLGYNADNEPIGEVLKEWIGQTRPAGRGPTRRLVVSQMPDYLDWLGIERVRPKKGVDERGPDMNCFVDVGVEGDERFVIGGATLREDWGAIPKDAFGASEGKLTCRWTPGSGATTTLLLPFSPNRDHLLRLQGSGFRPNRAEVLLGSTKVGTIDIRDGMAEYEVRLPASAVGPAKVAEVKLVYEKANVPKEIDPERYSNETRVCNLSLDWVQISTDNIPAHTTKQSYSFPKEKARFEGGAPGALAGRTFEVDWLPREALAPASEQLRSRHASDGTPRDIVVRQGENEVWYVNGLAGAAEGRLLEPLVTDWAGLTPEWKLEGDHVLGALLNAGKNTRLAVVYNYDTTAPRKIRLTIPMPTRSLAEAQVISRDGVALRPLTKELTVGEGQVVIEDEIRYYAAYQVAFGPVEAEMPELVVTQGSSARFDVTFDNNEPRPATVTISLLSPVPTITAASAGADLTDYEDKTVPIEITCAPEADWGEKTVVFDLSVSGEHVYLWRKLKVLRAPDLEVATPVIDAAHPRLAVSNTEHPLTPSGEARSVRVKLAEHSEAVGNLPGGATAGCEITVPAPTDAPALTTRLAELSWTNGEQALEKVQPVKLATYPRVYSRVSGALAPILVFNASEQPLQDAVVTVPTAWFRRFVKRNWTRLYVRDDSGAAIPSQVSADRADLLFVATLAPNAGRTFYACLGEGPRVLTELAATPNGLGTGHGRVTIGNQALELVLDEPTGATAVSLRSLVTNTEYAAKSFGAALGTWGQYNPLAPATSSVDLLKNLQRSNQYDGPARLTLLESGPVRAVVRADWHGPAFSATQEYAVQTKSPYVRVSSSAKPLRKLKPNEQLVLLDGRLQRAALTKIFPNFVGITETFEEDMIQHGWRMAPYVPDYFTCMTPPTFAESVSLVLLKHQGVDWVRQGFWPAERGKPGPCTYAWIELLARGPASATVDVLLHPGHQPIARQHLDSQRKPPLTLVPERFTWEE